MFLLNVFHYNYYFSSIVCVAMNTKNCRTNTYIISPAASHVNGQSVHTIVYGSDLDLSSIHWISVKTRTCYNNIVCT